MATRFATTPGAGLFTDGHGALRSVIRQFVGRGLRPHAEEWERAGDFPVREVFRQAGTVGVFGAKYEPEYGGTGPDLIADAVITEELALSAPGGGAAALGAHKGLGPYSVYRFGTDGQRQRYGRPAGAC